MCSLFLKAIFLTFSRILNAQVTKKVCRIRIITAANTRVLVLSNCCKTIPSANVARKSLKKKKKKKTDCSKKTPTEMAVNTFTCVFTFVRSFYVTKCFRPVFSKISRELRWSFFLYLLLYFSFLLSCISCLFQKGVYFKRKNRSQDKKIISFSIRPLFRSVAETMLTELPSRSVY